MRPRVKEGSRRGALRAPWREGGGGCTANTHPPIDRMIIIALESVPAKHHTLGISYKPLDQYFSYIIYLAKTFAVSCSPGERNDD